ncbi:hypothetical protein [Lewinella sp. IMCC34191]|uniref:hypothetical protein n=1 Tax=Lewinella sp. IMCC34191 TaxID=2259172 RepID=UPI000E2603A6|nr:hypothetical protein [Lewinella sp. IMCC34191]
MPKLIGTPFIRLYCFGLASLLPFCVLVGQQQTTAPLKWATESDSSERVIDTTGTTTVFITSDGYYVERTHHPETGRIIAYTRYRDKRRHRKTGPAVTFYNNGKVHTRANYVNNVLSGPYIMYYASGQKMGAGFFFEGKLKGKWKWYAPSGMHISKDDFHPSRARAYMLTYAELSAAKSVKLYQLEGSPPTEEEKAIHADSLWQTPMYPGCQYMLDDLSMRQCAMNRMALYLAYHSPYTLKFQKFNVENSVLVTFVIQRDGSLGELEVLRGSPRESEEVLRLFRSMPAWIPGEYDGKFCPTRAVLPVSIDVD